MRNVIIWHWFIKNLAGTWRRNDVDATSLRCIDVFTTSCACWEFAPPLPPPNILNLAPPPPPPQYSKPSYAYVTVTPEILVLYYFIISTLYLILLKTSKNRNNWRNTQEKQLKKNRSETLNPLFCSTLSVISFLLYAIVAKRMSKFW